MKKTFFKDGKQVVVFRFDKDAGQLVRYKSTKKRRPTIGIIIDTDLKIPPITGVTYRLYYLSRALEKNNVKIKIFLCNREAPPHHGSGILADDSNIEFHLIPEGTFYDPLKLQEIISQHRLDVIQFEDAVSALRYGRLAKKLNIPICLE